jgi:SAM-dependent methyltransferase
MNERVKAHYDQNAAKEWNRLREHPFEFLFTTYEMDRFIQDGDSILDLGGGPGRYAIHYAKKGHPVTLVDLSEGNIRLAKKKARQYRVHLKAYAQDCLKLEALNLGTFDHVFLMGPLYHLLAEKDRIEAVAAALRHLKKGGHLYVSFVLSFAGVIYDLKNGGCLAKDLDPDNAIGEAFAEAVASQKDYAGMAFTDVFFIDKNSLEPFMAKFPLKKEILFGQEGILAPNEKDLLKRPRKERGLWIEFSKKFLGVDYLLPYSEHALWIGKK